jgi:hypothetical protein
MRVFFKYESKFFESMNFIISDKLAGKVTGCSKKIF